MKTPDIDWLCARYPSLSEAIVVAVCSEYDTEAEAERQLSSINPNLNFEYDENDDDDENEIVAAAAPDEIDEIELESPDEDIPEFEKRLEALITSHDKEEKPIPRGPAKKGYASRNTNNNNGKSPKKQNVQLAGQKNNVQLSPKKSTVPLSSAKNFHQDITNISELLSLPFQRVERVYHWKQCKADFKRTILELILTAKTPAPTDADTALIENTSLVYSSIPWAVVVRLCLFVQGKGDKAFEIAEKIRDFDAWDSLIIPEVEGIEQPALEPGLESSEASNDPEQFTRVGDKASTEKVRASMSLSQQSQHYDELQHMAKTNLMNTTDPALRHEFKKTYEELKDKNHNVKKRIAKLTKPANETLWYTDLHGLYVHEAMRVAKVKIESWWEVEGGKSAKEIRPLTLNTGLGSHSPGGFSKIKVALTKWLSIEGWIHEVHKGHIQVVRK